MHIIRLKSGEEALVDDEDYPRLAQYTWYASPSGKILYAKRYRGHTSIFMHRDILGLEGPRIDHWNHNGLDNQRANLRRCTPGQNLQNQRPSRQGTSQYKGVTWHTLRQKWRATIRIDGRQTHLGLYESEEDAAHVYDEAACEHFGDFACLNFPENRVNVRSTLQQYATYKGVEHPRPGRWRARIRVKDKLLHLGTFDSPEDAAQAYDAAARFYYGVRARCNFDLEK